MDTLQITYYRVSGITQKITVKKKTNPGEVTGISTGYPLSTKGWVPNKNRLF